MSSAAERSLGNRLLEAARLRGGTPHDSPSAAQIVIASALALGGSLLADAVLVALGEALFPATKGFRHFRFSDYALLTGLGVAAACAAWPVVTRFSWAPRWLFARLAVVVTLVLFLPDLWILLRHEPPHGVLVLAVMHLAVALVTYHALVHVAPVRPLAEPALASSAGAAVEPLRRPPARRAARRSRLVERRAAWALMSSLVGVELVLGTVALVLVPFGRGNALVPHHGEAAYLLHAVLGAVLGAGALWFLVALRHSPRVLRISAAIGLAGLILGGAGGALAVERSWRLLGAALMMLGGGIAACAYLVPAVEAGDGPGAGAAALAACAAEVPAGVSTGACDHERRPAQGGSADRAGEAGGSDPGGDGG